MKAIAHSLELVSCILVLRLAFALKLELLRLLCPPVTASSAEYDASQGHCAVR